MVTIQRWLLIGVQLLYDGIYAVLSIDKIHTQTAMELTHFLNCSDRGPFISNITSDKN